VNWVSRRCHPINARGWRRPLPGQPSRGPNARGLPKSGGIAGSAISPPAPSPGSWASSGWQPIPSGIAGSPRRRRRANPASVRFEEPGIRMPRPERLSASATWLSCPVRQPGWFHDPEREIPSRRRTTWAGCRA
jgi:hypothetical protein